MSYRRDARLLAMLACNDESGRAGLKARLERFQDRWEGADGDELLIAMRGAAEDGARNDAVLQVAVADPDACSELPKLAGLLRNSLSDIIDADASTVVVGVGHRINERRGSKFFALLGRRDPAIDAAAMHRWWIEDHAPLAAQLLERTGFGYVQIHVDEGLSASAAGELGVPFQSWDMGDSIEVEDVDAFLSVASAPETVARLMADEDGHIDRSSLRGGFFDRLSPK